VFILWEECDLKLLWPVLIFVEAFTLIHWGSRPAMAGGHSICCRDGVTLALRRAS